MVSSPDPTRRRISVTACYADGWRAFSGWWIPITAVAAAVVVFQLLPEVLLALDLVEKWGEALAGLLDALRSEDVPALERAGQAISEITTALGVCVGLWTLALLPVVALLTVVLLLLAVRAVQRRARRVSTGPAGAAPRERAGRVLYISLVHASLGLVKVAALLLLVVPGVYIYVRLMFVPLVMLEEAHSGAADAIRSSWRLTRGNFWRLLLLVLMNAGVQLVVAPSIIGLIPATGFVGAVRAAAFETLRRPHNS